MESKKANTPNRNKIEHHISIKNLQTDCVDLPTTGKIIVGRVSRMIILRANFRALGIRNCAIYCID